MGLEVNCAWCNKPKTLPHRGRLNLSGLNFCDTKCQWAHNRGYEITLELKQAILELKNEGFEELDIRYIMQISKSAYWVALQLEDK